MNLNFLKTRSRTKHLWLVGFAFVFACVLNIKLLFWLFERWMALPYGPLGFGIFALGLIQIVINRRTLLRNKILHSKWLITGLILSVFATFHVLIPYHILQVFLLFMAFGVFTFSLFQLPSQSQFTFLGWLSFSLPLVPVLGSSVGLVNREIYTSILNLLSPNTYRWGTSLYTGPYAFHIDASCSGAQGIYLLTGVWFLMHLFFEAKHIYFKRLLEMLLLYWVLNGLRVAILYTLHNGFQLSGVDTLDQILGLATFTFTLIFIMVRSARTLKF